MIIALLALYVLAGIISQEYEKEVFAGTHPWYGRVVVGLLWPIEAVAVITNRSR